MPYLELKYYAKRLAINEFEQSKLIYNDNGPFKEDGIGLL